MQTGNSGEQAERESQERFIRIFRANPAAMAYTDGQNGRILDANDRFLLVFGYPREEVVGRSTRDIEIWVDLNERDRLLEIAVTQGSVRDAQCQLRTKEGDVRDVVLSMEVLRESGQSTFLWMVTDITERKRTDDALRMQSRVLESMREGVNVTDTETGTILFSNSACDAMFGYERGAMMGLHVSRLYDLPQRETDDMMGRIREALRTTGNWSGEMRNRRRNGQPLSTRVKISVVDILGRACTVAVREDITEQKSLESRLFRAQRLEALGSLAGGIAHDMNNILAPIMMAVPLLRTEPVELMREKLLSTIEASAMRGAHLVKQLLLFGRGIEGHRGVVRLKVAVAEIEQIISVTFPRNIRISAEIAPDAWPVRADPTQVHQVLLNLCVNARDAMARGGELEIRTDNMMLTAPPLLVAGEFQPGAYVRITVSDTGTGIAPQYHDRLFDPFFTTKEVGKGTGLGLSTVAAIAKANGGFVSFESEVDEGSAFHVYLPAIPGTNPPFTAHASVPPPKGRQETVLVVDDDEGVRDLTRATLAHHGYNVLVAADGAEAVVLFSRHREDVRIVVTDFDMPFMDGISLARVIKTLAPDVRVIVASGMHSDLRIAERKVELTNAGVSLVLAKPYRSEQILKAIHDLLSGETDDIAPPSELTP